MNGSAQEMIDEERDYYNSINEEPPSGGCLEVVVMAMLGILIFFIL